MRLKPDSAEARTNLAASLIHSGKSELAGEQFRKALDLEPMNFDANHNLAEFYIQSKKVADALPLLERAQRINPSSYDNGYDLALAYFLTGRLSDARQFIQTILPPEEHRGTARSARPDRRERGKFVEAVNEFETAAHLDPSEDNLFDWGSELLLHRTYEPAIDVFEQATQRYPKSAAADDRPGNGTGSTRQV